MTYYFDRSDCAIYKEILGAFQIEIPWPATLRLRLAPNFEMIEGMNHTSGELEPTDPSDENTSINIRRCAVYACVSSSNRDDTPLSSIEAQIESASCKSYIQAQKGSSTSLEKYA